MNLIRIVLSAAFIAVIAPLFAQCGSSTSNNHNEGKAVKASYTLQQDIVEIAAGAADFSTLVAAVTAADLVGTLKSEGPFTVFAPVNSAFAKLPEGTVASLLEPANKGTLTKVLTYHVVAGEFKAKDVIDAIKAHDGSFSIKTVSGGVLKATLQSGTVILTDENGGVAAITKTDLDASNGVIHVIDSVVLPK